MSREEAWERMHELAQLIDIHTAMSIKKHHVACVRSDIEELVILIKLFENDNT